ncbi:helicase C-terminal domain-containing protein [Lacticaseibacillus mingshuiensis]|uniref:helicase C-terminal domain-containing protein n=1 Tax=Lacticaseibacillus mingshuiensis TaxID=2799574 RepID=UPI00194DE313|nr:helicase C-terminal domain-containing protein [Lacticaseibacillus mingshuiensis]
MGSDTIYAVIDLETTGTSIEDGDRIIQFGCALLQRGKIIQTVSQLINPERSVPEAIQQLTGIRPADLTAAPYFDDVASTISGLLEGTVIVAHNINFDYPFLSAALAEVGEPVLTQPGIDTVELAQILLPTQASFRLSDLTSVLAIRHDNPHRADSDAISTAKLLLALADRFRALPTVTQRHLAQLGKNLLRDTGDFLASLVQPLRPLAHDQRQVGPFILRQSAQPVATGVSATDFPLTDRAKKAVLMPTLRFRKGQAEMMDAIYQNVCGPRQPLMIEAGTGLGKSLGYLLPYAFLTDAAQQVVVATSTNVLQAQLVNETIPLLGQLLQHPVSAVLLKSPRHYLDLAKFDATLAVREPNRLTRLLQMKLIVWLTETTTGDLDELHLTNYRAPLFAQVRSTGEPLPANDPYRSVDFYGQVQHALASAQVIVTNHAYLARHSDLLASHGRPYLVVDEAQHFADQTAAAFSQKIDLRRLHQLLGSVLATIDHGGTRRDLTQIFADDALMRYQLSSFQTLVRAASELVEDLQQTLYHHFDLGRSQTPGFIQVPLHADEVSWLLDHLKQPLGKLQNQLAGILTGGAALGAGFQAEPDRFLVGDAPVFQALDGLLERLGEQAEAITSLDPAAMRAGEDGVVCLTLLNRSDVSSLQITWDLFFAGHQIQALLSHFTAPVFVGATLRVDRNFQYLTAQLGYSQLDGSQEFVFRSPFHYHQQAQLFVADDAPQPQPTQQNELADYYAKAISQLADDDHQTIVLFTSLAMIKSVYIRLLHQPVARRKELLAQGVTGSAEKIAKRFAIADNSLLLGAASFFEGIDYPDRQLERVILTHLPFDAPDDPVVKARGAQLQAAGRSPFEADSLPRATLRLRQSFGRLIRTETDRGVFIVLDPRLLSTAYGTRMLKALPAVRPLTLPTAQIGAYARSWLEHRPMTKKEASHASSTSSDMA